MSCSQNGASRRPAWATYDVLNNRYFTVGGTRVDLRAERRVQRCMERQLCAKWVY